MCSTSLFPFQEITNLQTDAFSHLFFYFLEELIFQSSEPYTNNNPK